MDERQEALILPQPLFRKIFLGEAGRDHRGAVQRSGPGRNPVSSKCWRVGGSPGRLVQIIPDNYNLFWKKLCILKMTHVSPGGD